MSKTTLKKEKWTLSFNPQLKQIIIREAKKKGVYPVAILEEIVREKFNPYGYTEVKDSLSYVRALREESKAKSDEAFLEEIRQWQKSISS